MNDARNPVWPDVPRDPGNGRFTPRPNTPPAPAPAPAQPTKLNEVACMNHLENSRLALRLWRERVKPDNVVGGLRRWLGECGCHACFGGHLATWPEFQAMGVKRGPVGEPDSHSVYSLPRTDVEASTGELVSVYRGEPYMDGVGDGIPTGVHLFGASLFEPRGDCVYDQDIWNAHPLYVSDYDLVVKRLQHNIARLEASQ
jgi:hypothetical protein